MLTHPLPFSADCVTNDICPIGCACGRDVGGLPADLQDPWSLPTEHLNILGWQRRPWEVTNPVCKKNNLLRFTDLVHVGYKREEE